MSAEDTRQEAREAASDASSSLARLGFLARWAGEGMSVRIPDLKTIEANQAALVLEWVGQEIERYCAIIDEGF